MAGAESPRSRRATADGNERRHVLGEMHERAIGLAVADGRTVGLARRVHEDGGTVGQHQARIGARRGIALQIFGGRFGVVGCGKEMVELHQAGEPRLPLPCPVSPSRRR